MCESFFDVPLSLCLPNTASWNKPTDLQSTLRLMIECQDATVVSSRQCDAFRADLYKGLRCPQCVEIANAVAAASAVCDTITSESQCSPDAADASAAFEEDSSIQGSAAVAPASDGLELIEGA
jgi:hypothetical protein